MENQNLIELTGKNVSVESMMNVIKKFIEGQQGMMIDEYRLTFKMHPEGEELAADIFDKFAKSRVGVLGYHQKAEFIKEFLNIYGRITGNHVDFDSVWHERNFNRFSLSVGCSYIISPQEFSPGCDLPYVNVYSIADYLHQNGDTKDTLVTKLEKYFNSATTRTIDENVRNIPVKRFFSETVFVIVSLLTSIDPINGDKYRELTPHYSTAGILHSEFNKTQDNVAKLMPDVNKWLRDVGCTFNFEVSDIPTYTTNLIRLVMRAGRGLE